MQSNQRVAVQSPSESSLSIWLLWLAGLGAAMQFAKFSVFFQQLRGVYVDAGTSLGFLVSLISAMGVIFGVVAGLMVARFGYRRILLISLLAGGALSFLQAFILPFPVMLFSRVAEGASHLGIVVAAPTLIAALAGDKWRAAAMTLWGSFFGVAFAMAALVGPAIVNVGGLPLLFAAHGGWMLACAALLALVVPSISAGKAIPLSIGDIMRRHVAIYRSAQVSAAAWGWLFYTLTFVAGLTVLPEFLSPKDAILFLAAAPILSIVFSLSFGVLLLRYTTAIGVVVIGFALALVATVGLILLPGMVWVPIALFCVLGLVQGASFAAIPQLNTNDNDRALATGALAQTGNIGNLVGTPLLLAAADFAGLSGVVLFLLLAYCGGLLVHLILASVRRRQLLAS